MFKKRSISVAVSAVLLAGCSTAMVSSHRVTTNQNAEAAATAIDSIRNGRQVMSTLPAKSLVERKSGMYIPATRAEETSRTALLRENPALQRQITFVDKTFNSIMEVAERVTVKHGVPVQVAPDASVNAAIPQGMMQQQGAMGLNGLPQNGVGMAGMPPLPNGSAIGLNGMPYAGAMGFAGASAYNTVITLSYDGPLAGFLDIVAARYGLGWDMQDGKINFFRNVTKTFVIQSIPGEVGNSAAISSSGQTTTGTGGSSTQATAQSSGLNTSAKAESLSIWKAIEASVQTMLTPNSGKVSVSPATGTITVTDTTRVVDMVEKFIDRQNAHMGKQVVVNVQVLTVSLDKTDNYGVNWDAVYNSITGNTGWAFSNAYTSPTGASSLSMKVLSTATGDKLGRLAGSQAVISALSTQGDVSVVTTASATTLNNQPVPVQVGKQTAYLASSSTIQSTTAGVAPTTTLTPGTVTTGFSMNILPHIQSDGSLLLQYALDISELTALRTVTSNGSSIQTPEVETRNFLQRVSLKSGETLILSGFERVETSANTQGVGSADNAMLGGGVSGAKGRSLIVVLLQPIVVNN